MEINSKSTKQEIMDAYEALLKEVKNAKANEPKKIQAEKQQTETVAKVASITKEGILQNIADLKGSLNTALEHLSDGLCDEFARLEDIRNAMKIEKQSLEDLYSLSANADSLAAMILTQKAQKETFEKQSAEAKAAFEQEMNQKKAQWEAEKVQQKAEEKEYNDDLNKRRKREEEEYQYNLKISRQKDQTAYDIKFAALQNEMKDKKAAFEQEMAQREQEVKATEMELAELRKNNEEFPTRLEQALKNQEKEISASLKMQHDFEIKMLKVQHDADIKVKDQLIQTLQEKIQELQGQMKDYLEKANRADADVKEIAVKAIENAGKVQMLTAKTENIEK